MDPYWKGWTISCKICFNLTNNYKNHFSKRQSFSWGKCLLLYSNNWCYLFLNVLLNQVCVDNRLTLNIPPTKEIVVSVKCTLSDIYNSIQLNKKQRSEATFLSQKKTGELTSRLPTLCSSTRTGAISPSTSSSWRLEGHRVAVRTLVRPLRSHSGGFSWWGHGAECMHVGG